MAKKKKGFLSGLILSAKKTAKNSKRDNDDKKQTKNVQAKQKTSKQTQKVVKQQTQKATGTANTNTVKKSAQKAYSASVQAQKDFANKTVKSKETYTGNKLERQNTVKAAGKAYDTYASQQRQKAKVNIEKEIGRQLTADEENKVFGDYDKSVSEGKTKYLNNTRKAYNKQNTVKYKTGITLNSDEANKMQTYAMQGKVQDYAFSKDKNGKPTKLAKKLAQQNLGNMLEGGAKTASTAVLDRLANSQDATTTMTKKGLYSEKQQKAIQQAKDSKAYKAGTFVGEGLNFVAPGAAGASLAKNAGKTVVKGLVKDAAKNGVKDALKVSGKDAVKAVGKDVAYDSLASLPLNVQSAVKDSTGTDGKINTKAFAASLGLNVAGDVVLGGAVSGAGKAITAKSVGRYAKLVEKANTKGVNALSTDELKTFEKLNTKFAGKTIDKNTIDSGAINKAKELDSNGTAGKVSAMNELNKTTLSKKEANSFIKLLGREKAGVLSDTEKVQLDNLKKKTAELNTSANKLEATKQADTGINPDVVMGNSNAAETAVKTENIGSEAQVKNAEPTQKIDNAEIAEAPKAEVPTGKADTVNAAEVSTDSLHKKSQDFARELAGQRGKARKETTTFIRENVKNLADTIKYGNDLDAEMSADAIAKDIVANTKYTARDTEDDMLADAIGSLRNKWIRIPSNDIPADFKEFAASAKKLGLNLTANPTKGKPIDEVFEELKEIAPHWFSDERMGGSEYYQESPLDQIVNAFANKPQSREMSIIDYIEEEVSNFGGTADDVADMIAKEESSVRDRLIKIATEEAQRVDTKVAKTEDAELIALKNESNALKYKIRNTENPEHYKDYVTRKNEVDDRIEEIYLAKKGKALKNPTKSTIQNAEDLENAASGKYVDDLKNVAAETSGKLDSFMRLFVDSFNGFEKYARSLGSEQRKELMGIINAVRNSRNKASGMITAGTQGIGGKSRSLNDIFGNMLKKSNSNEYADFNEYCFHKHNIDRYEEGKGVFGEDITSADSASICKQLEEQYPNFKNKHTEVVRYLRELQQYRVDTGLVSKDVADYMDAMYPNYVPTYRVSEGKIVKNHIDLAVKGRVVKANEPLKAATGGTSDIIPLHKQISNLTNYTIKLGEQNRLFKFIADTNGVDVNKIDPDVTLDDAIKASTIPSTTTDGATNKYWISYYDNGELKQLEVNSQMYSGIKEWRKDPDSLADAFNWKAHPVRSGNQLFKNLITGWNPLFGAYNIIKDTGEALIYTKNVKGFIKCYPKAISAIINPKSEYRKYFDLYLASGGRYEQLREVMTTFNTDSYFKTVIKSPIKICQKFNDCLESIPRMSEFISTIDKSLDGKPLSSIDTKTLDEAMLNANDITVNFGRKGVAGSALNSTVIPYLNPAIQGVDKFARMFRDAKADGVKGMLSLMGKISAFSLAPAMINEVMMSISGGEAWKQLNTRDKDNYYFIPMGDGKFIKIPKSRVGSALAAPFEHVYRTAMYGDPLEFKEMFTTAWQNIGITNPVTSNLFSPVLNALSNKTWFGGTIENARDLDYRAAGQKKEIYDEGTSAISIWIGGKLNISPKKVDYVIDGYTGVIGDFLLPLTTESQESNPIYRKFIVDSVFSNKLATQFWSKSDLLESKSNVSGKTGKYENWKAKYMYDSITLSSAIYDIDGDKSLSSKQKAEKKRELRKLLNEYYRAGIDGKSTIKTEPLSAIAKQIGADKTLTNYMPLSMKDSYPEYKKLEGYKNATAKKKKQIANDFLDTYSLAVKTQSNINVQYHSTPDWETIAVANAQRGGRDNISKSLGVYDDTIEKAKTYVKYGGNTKRYAITEKRIDTVTDKLIKNKSIKSESSGLYKYNIKSAITSTALASGAIKYKDLAYYISGSIDKMNAARGATSKYNWTPGEIARLGFSADTNGNTYFTKAEITTAVDNSRAKTSEEKAMLFELLYGKKGNNPFGSIKDYSLKSDTGITDDSDASSGKSGYGRHGYGGWGHGGGGGGGSSFGKSWETYYGELVKVSKAKNAAVKAKDNTSKSALTEAYRKREQKRLEKLRKN